MELTKEEAIRQHRKMWLWIAEETEKRKRVVSKNEYFKKMKTNKKDIPLNTCYCCEYTRIGETLSYKCEMCPISWDGIENHCCDLDSSFQLWANTHDWQVAAEAARAIAELPERQVF